MWRRTVINNNISGLDNIGVFSLHDRWGGVQYLSLPKMTNLAYLDAKGIFKLKLPIDRCQSHFSKYFV